MRAPRTHVHMESGGWPGNKGSQMTVDIPWAAHPRAKRTFLPQEFACTTDVRTESGGWHGDQDGEMTEGVPRQHILEHRCTLA